MQSWSQRFVGNIKLQLAMAHEILRRLEIDQDKRPLSDREHQFFKEIKMKSLALASLERTIARQRSRLLWLTEGDANTQFFHLQACHRRRKNHIESLVTRDQIIFNEEQKEDIIFKYFDEMLGTSQPREVILNLEELGVPRLETPAVAAIFLNLRSGRSSESCRRRRLQGLMGSRVCSTKWHGR